jgi:hypothetical protein
MPPSVSDIGIVLEFLITENGAPADLSATTPKLYVKDNINSPFTLEVGVEPGVATYSVQEDDFSAGVSLAVIVVEVDATHQFRGTPFLFEVEPLFGWGV